MLNSICAEYDNLTNIIFPQIRDNRIGVLFGADTFIATVPLKFTTGPPATPHGVLTHLGWTVTGPIPQKHKSTSIKQEINYNITLYNRIKKPRRENRERHASNVLNNGGKKFSERKKDVDSRGQESSWNTEKDDMPEKFSLWGRNTLERWQ